MEGKKIRIIITILVPQSDSHRGNTGGLVRLTEIFKRLAFFGDVNIVLVSSDKNYQDYFRENNIDVDFKLIKSKMKFRSNFGLGLKSIFIIIKSFFVLRTDFLKSDDDNKVVVYSSSDLFWEVIPAFFYKIKNKNIKWLQVIHHIYPDWRERRGNKITNYLGYYLQRFSLKLVKKKADKVIVVNSFVKNELIRMGFLSGKVSVSSNGINYEYLDKIEKGNGLFDGCFLGRLDHSKGIYDLIDIWEYVCRRISTVKLAIIGENFRNRKELEEIVKGKKLQDNIIFYGFLENDEAFPISKSSKVFLFPSHEEGWGISIAEAMACGLPAIVWDLPAYKTVFEDQLIQVKENDIEKFSDEVVKLLYDKEKQKEMGDSNKKFIRKYSWENVASKELEIINSI